MTVSLDNVECMSPHRHTPALQKPVPCPPSCSPQAFSSRKESEAPWTHMCNPHVEESIVLFTCEKVQKGKKNVLFAIY